MVLGPGNGKTPHDVYKYIFNEIAKKEKKKGVNASEVKSWIKEIASIEAQDFNELNKIKEKTISVLSKIEGEKKTVKNKSDTVRNLAEFATRISNYLEPIILEEKFKMVGKELRRAFMDRTLGKISLEIFKQLVERVLQEADPFTIVQVFSKYMDDFVKRSSELQDVILSHKMLFLSAIDKVTTEDKDNAKYILNKISLVQFIFKDNNDAFLKIFEKIPSSYHQRQLQINLYSNNMSSLFLSTVDYLEKKLDLDTIDAFLMSLDQILTKEVENKKLLQKILIKLNRQGIKNLDVYGELVYKLLSWFEYTDEEFNLYLSLSMFGSSFEENLTRNIYMYEVRKIADSFWKFNSKKLQEVLLEATFLSGGSDDFQKFLFWLFLPEVSGAYSDLHLVILEHAVLNFLEKNGSLERDDPFNLVTIEAIKSYFLHSCIEELKNTPYENQKKRIFITSFINKLSDSEWSQLGYSRDLFFSLLEEKNISRLLALCSKNKPHYKADDDHFFSYLTNTMLYIFRWAPDNFEKSELSGEIQTIKDVLKKFKTNLKDSRTLLEEYWLKICDKLNYADVIENVQKIKLLSFFIRDVANYKEFKYRLELAFAYLFIEDEDLIVENAKDIEAFETHVLDLTFKTLDLKSLEKLYLEKKAHTFDSSREPLAWLIYAFSISNIINKKDESDEIGIDTSDEESETEKEVTPPLLKRNFILFMESVLNGTFRRERYQDKGRELTPHIHRLNKFDARLFEQWSDGGGVMPETVKVNNKEYVIENTDKWDDLLLSGTDVMGSCQRILGDPLLNKCLLGYILNGYNRMICIRNKEGFIQTRAIFRILWNETEKKPALFLEKAYPEKTSEQSLKAIKEYAIKIARSLNCDLYDSGEKEKSLRVLQSFGGIAAFEYADSASKDLNVFERGKFVIEESHLIYHAQ